MSKSHQRSNLFGGAATCTLLASALFLAGSAAAQPTPGTMQVALEPVATGLTAPLIVVTPPDGSGRLFVVTQRGQILIIKNGALRATPFLDVAASLPVLNNGFDERGLLGLAFHPEYALNGRFFVRHSVPRTGVAGEPCFGTGRGCHREVLEEYSVSNDPNVANPVGTELITVDKPQFNHNGAHVQFGPDGMLYFSLGDGGGAHDGLADNPPSHGPIGNGQNLNAILGKMNRIDVDAGSPYAIPADNPFAAGGGRGEIYAYGLRNPYRFCFDNGPGGDGRLICADVGQARFEEINIITRGGNYGWVIREGLHCFDPFNPSTPPASCATTGAMGEPLINPVAEYDHAVGISITGGVVYRGSRFPELYGKYVFGDWSTGFAAPNGSLFYVDADGDMSSIRRFLMPTPLGRYVLGFGVDADGEIYLCSSQIAGPTGTTGNVSRLVVVCRGDVDLDFDVDLTDLALLLTNFGTAAGATHALGDIDDDGDVDLTDLAILLTGFGSTCP